MSVRAYDPSIGRCISREPLGQAPLFFGSSLDNNPDNNAAGRPETMVDIPSKIA
jgi:hypothetical protein